VITQVLNSYIAASKQAEEAYLAKSTAARRYQRFVVGGSTLFSLLAVLLGVAAWWNHDWLGYQLYLLRNVRALTAAQELDLKPGETFSECANCPDMVVIPAGSFMMGLPDNVGGEDAHPQHSVTIAEPFAVSKYEVTFTEWDACAAQGGCNAHVLDNGWGRGQQPVINVRWEEAQEYAGWLSKITGKPYRLLSEAEYEYAARGGTTTQYPWGNDVGYNNANCNGCGRNLDLNRTLPVGSFPPNKFGLYDMVGNVWEWTEDCENVGYDGAPTDGTARTSTGACNERVVRGGAWDDDPTSLLSTSRSYFYTQELGNRIGFRIARTLSTSSRR
jgi:formylglycine-generating enzyme required for sulfatase activity